jgi:hypothetical protein
MASTPRVRKNIDDLTTEELDTYTHAISRLRDISKADPASIDGYAYLAQLYGGDQRPDEHANDTFLPWHRAHLWLFEEALRRSDPPRTANVTIPYWDWSALPSGQRYPKAFEDTSSVLFATRNSHPICRQPGPTGCAQLPFPRSYVEENLLPSPHLPDTLEFPVRNTMHGNFIGGLMAEPASAALDPIFWSFYAYVDLIWWQWQQRPEHRLRVRDVSDSANELKVDYYYVGPTLFAAPPVPGQLFETHPAIDFVVSATRLPELTRSLDVEIPATGFTTARLNFSGVKAHTPFSYGIDIYLVPAEEPFRPQDRDFRKRYLVDFMFMWKGHASERGSTHDIAVDVTGPLTTLARSQAGRRWKVWIALAGSEPPPQTHHFKLAVAGASAPESWERINFRNVELKIH